MTLISCISSLRHPGVLRDFTWPADLPNFSRYNLIYGWNGSGKTTISKLFRSLEARTAPEKAEATLSINGRDVHGHEFAQATLPIRVFNREFVLESVFPVGGADVPPILVVGKESVEKQKKVEQLRKNLSDALTTLEIARGKKRDADRALDRHCIDQAGVIKNILRSSGQNPYNNYDKTDYRRRVVEMVKAGDSEAHHLDEAGRNLLRAQHLAIPKPKLPEISYHLPDLVAFVKTVSDLLQRTVVSAAIQSLKNDPDLSEWIHQGLGLHQARQNIKCLFCDQALPNDRLSELETHFSAEYDQFLNLLDEQILEQNKEIAIIDQLVVPNVAEFYDDLAPEYANAETILHDALDSVKAFFNSLVQSLTNKKSRVFEVLTFNDAVPEIDSAIVTGLVQVIIKHNQACDEFQTRVSQARRQLENDFVASGITQFQELLAAVQELEASINEVDARQVCLNEEIQLLEREIVEHRRPADELNEDLHRYLGHTELHLEVKDTGYAIIRNGASAQALSEGETTAIALLYFLKSLIDRRFDLSRGVVVLDDPVSSLDANALYLAFGFIRERAQNAGQLFILTHNFTFFRQVRNWFHKLKGQNKADISQRPARFYMLDCNLDGDQRCSTLRLLDPLLEKYESEYHYLFSRIYHESRTTGLSGLEGNYSLPNMARRLVETFLAFRQPQVSGELWHKFEEIIFDEAKKLRIIRFLHTYSHSDSVGEPEHDPSLLSEARPVLHDLLEMMESQDPKHFSAMVTLVTLTDEKGGDE